MFVSKKKWCAAIVACAVMTIAATASAQQQGKKAAAPARGTNKEAMARRAKAVWKNADTNKDGVVDLKEYLAFQKKEFARMDTNRDGKLTPQEFTAPRREAPRAKKPAQDGAGRGGEAIKRMFSNADANGDGKISRDEAPAQIGNRFDKIDSDGDGFLTIREIQQVMRGRRGGGGRR